MTAKRSADTFGREQAHYRERDASAGVSEIIGAVLLIMLVVAVVGLIAVYLFSQQTPSKVPNLKFMTGVDSTKTSLYLYHNGGDSMNSGEFSVLLDGKPSAYTISDGSTVWSVGKNLVIPITAVPDRIQLVYNTTSSGASVVISQAAVNVVNSQNVTPDQLPYLDCSAVRNWECADQIPPEIIVAQYMKNSSVQKTNFMKSGVSSAGGLIGRLNSAQYHFNFTVTKPNSTIVWGDSDCSPTSSQSLNPNDRVAIFFRSNAGPDDFIIFGMAPQIWEMAGGGLSEIGIDITFTNGTTTHTTGSRLCHTWISEYDTDTLDSTILIIGQSLGSSYTSLNINNSFIVQGQDATNITLVNFKPVPNGMFLISFEGSSTTPIFVVGWQDEIYRNGVAI